MTKLWHLHNKRGNQYQNQNHDQIHRKLTRQQAQNQKSNLGSHNDQGSHGNFSMTRISTSQKQPLSLVEYNTLNPNPNQPHTGKLLSTRSTQRSGRMRQRKNMIQLFGMGHGF